MLILYLALIFKIVNSRFHFASIYYGQELDLLRHKLTMFPIQIFSYIMVYGYMTIILKSVNRFSIPMIRTREGRNSGYLTCNVPADGKKPSALRPLLPLLMLKESHDSSWQGMALYLYRSVYKPSVSCDMTLSTSVTAVAR